MNREGLNMVVGLQISEKVLRRSGTLASWGKGESVWDAKVDSEHERRRGVETSGNIRPGRMRASSRLISLQRHAIGNIIQHPNSAFTLPLSSPPAAYTLNGFIIQYIQGHSYITILVCWLAKSNGWLNSTGTQRHSLGELFAFLQKPLTLKPQHCWQQTTRRTHHTLKCNH